MGQLLAICRMRGGGWHMGQWLAICRMRGGSWRLGLRGNGNKRAIFWYNLAIVLSVRPFRPHTSWPRAPSGNRGSNEGDDASLFRGECQAGGNAEE